MNNRMVGTRRNKRPHALASFLGVLLVLVLLASMFSVAAAREAQTPNTTAPQAASSLGNYVWLDANADGFHTGGEAEFNAGINDVKINLYLDANKNGVIDPGEFQTSTTTGNNPDPQNPGPGWYLFPDITANGNQFIVEIDPSNFATGGKLEGMILTSELTYKPNPMVVSLPQISVNYEDADFGFIKAPLEINKTLQNTSAYAALGATVIFRITVTNTSDTLTVNPAPLDDYYSPACLLYVSATVAPDTVDATTGWLHWNNIGPLAPLASVSIDVTFTAQSTNDMLWKEGGWKDYAPKGIPDFDERQPNWDNPTGSGSGWYQDGPVAMTNSLWWFDSKFESSTTPPPTIGDTYPLVVSQNLNVWDDHDPRNVQPLVNVVSSFMGTTAAAGTPPTAVATGVSSYLADRNLAASYTVTTQAKPTFGWTGDEVRRSEDVVLLLGFWQETLTGAPAVRLGGHYVTASGIDVANNKVALSDPIRNQAEATGAGRVLPGAHAGDHPPTVGVNGDTVHNDAQYVSQDVYDTSSTSISAGVWGLLGYVDPDLTTGCAQLAAFQGKNIPSEFAGQQGTCDPQGGPIVTTVEYAVAVSPLLNTPMCSPTTNIAAVTGATLQDSQWTLPPVQDEERVTEGMDFGDLPDTPYPTYLASDGARHLVTSPLRLGTLIDNEANGQPNATATGDDNSDQDDEDGVITVPAKLWQDGTTASGKGGALRIVIGGGSGIPQVFMDFGSGLQAVTLRDASGLPLATTPWPAGTYDAYFDIPLGTMAPGPVIEVRVRVSSSGGLGATGSAPDGEVEDYAFSFTPTAVSVQMLSAARTDSAGAVLALAAMLGLAVAGWRLTVARARGRG